MNNVDSFHPQYNTNRLTEWSKMEDVCTSETHMHSKKETYIKKLTKMSDTSYEAYVDRAEFPMFTKHALDSFVGMAMRKELLISGIDVDHEFLKNCDGKGTTLKQYCNKLVRNYLQFGRCGTLVDMPKADPNQSIALAEAKNIKTKLLSYDHASIINWKTNTVNNQDVLTLVVLEEEVDVSEDEFTHNIQPQYRVLKLEDGEYVQKVYDHEKKLVEFVKPTMKGKALNFIPFIIHGGYDIKSPIMLPIAEQNIHWYQKDADYQHGLHYTALPTPWTTGVDADDENAPQTIGPTELWYLPEGATCGMLEFTGKGLSEIAKSMDKTMTNITVLSSQILVPKNTFDETATAASIRNATETASLSSLVSDLSVEITLAVTIAAKWGRFYKDDISVEINSDFIPLTLSGADVSAYVSAVLKEGFSKKTLFELLKRGEIIEGDRQFEDEMSDIKKESEERMEKEIELQERLSQVEAKLAEMSKKDESTKAEGDTTSGDIKNRRTQGEAVEPEANSGIKKSKDNNTTTGE